MLENIKQNIMKKILITFIIILCSFYSKAQEATIIGNWQLTTVAGVGETETDLEVVFIFEDNGLLKAGKNRKSRTINAGTWTYNKKKKLIVLTSDLDQDFNGEATIIKLNDKELVYKKGISTFSFIKFDPPAKVVITMEKPILSFESDDMYDEGNFNYEEAVAKLPWTIKTIVNYLKNYTEMVYSITSFPDEQEPFAWVESEKINYKETEQTIDVREYSYYQNDYIDMMEDPILIDNLTEYEEDFMFFPKDNLDIYQVVGTEKIETPAGVFECTIVEGFGRFNAKVKYWMVNEKPGVFAKVINVKDAPVPYGNTKVYVLKEIK